MSERYPLNPTIRSLRRSALFPGPLPDPSADPDVSPHAGLYVRSLPNSPPRMGKTGLKVWSGFSLVEMMVALALGLLLTLAASTAFLGLRQSQVEQERLVSMKETLRFTTDFMTRDIRGASLTAEGGFDRERGLVPDAPGTPDQQRFTVRKAGMNCLGEVGPWVVSVYSVHNHQLRCGDEGTPPQNQPLVEGVRDMRAVALNAAGQPDWGNPSALQIELEFMPRPGSKNPGPVLEFLVALRNPLLAEVQAHAEEQAP